VTRRGQMVENQNTFRHANERMRQQLIEAGTTDPATFRSSANAPTRSATDA
jgi:hypothetical protein